MSARPTGETPCRLCGMPILFRKGASGATMPLQRVRRAYTLGADRRTPVELEVAQGRSLWVSHFETCYRASEAKRKRAPQETP